MSLHEAFPQIVQQFTQESQTNLASTHATHIQTASIPANKNVNYGVAEDNMTKIILYKALCTLHLKL